jgi:hypothetical protein
VAVAVAAERDLRIVHVQALQSVDAAGLDAFVEHLGQAVARAHLEA